MYCHNPFNDWIIGRPHSTCCADWLSHEAKPNIKTDNPWEVWNSDALQNLRESILDSSFRYCHRCPVYINKRTAGRHLPDHKVVMDRGPRKIMVGDDQTCNLKCWQCRPVVVTEKQQEAKRQFLHRALEVFGTSVIQLSLLHTGDPFASPTYRPFLQEYDASDYPKIRVNLFTNGLLMPRYWDSMKKARNGIRSMVVSIDGATKETYEKMRVGGKFEDIQEALKLIKGLRKLGYLERVIGRFTITNMNFREMPAFVEMLADHCFTGVDFGPLRVRNMKRKDDNGMTVEEFREFAVCDERNPEHKEYLSVLDDPWMKHPIVLHIPPPNLCKEFARLDDMVK